MNALQDARRVKITAMGSYIPKKKVLSVDLDEKLGLAAGTLENLSGVKSRYYVGEGETASKMGAMACMAALENAHLKYEDIDAIICASGTYEQPIPCTAALIQKALGKEESGTACFDINATCLGFVVGFDIVSTLLQSKRFHRVLLVSSDIASVGLPWHQLEACALFGDGAVAAVLERSDTTRVLGSHQETYSSGSATCEITGGGTGIHPRHYNSGKDDPRFLFNMDGRKVFRQASERMPEFMARLEQKTGVKLQDYKLVIPHQASGSAMELIRRRLDIESDRWMQIVGDYGNMIAASIPLALKLAIETKRIQRGDRVLLMGTSAGFSIGAVGFEY